jgi:hypothetical protein
MKINRTGNCLFPDVLEKNTSPIQTLKEIFTEKKEIPIRVSISEKGKGYYRKSIQEFDGDIESYDTVIERRDQLLEAKLSTDLDYDFQLGGEVRKYKQDGVPLTTREKADNLFRAYAKLYDEIIQGYENGTREIHVEDINLEKNYRVLTKEEEIDALNNSYKKYAEVLEEQAKQEPVILKALQKYIKKLEELGVEKPKLAQHYYDSIEYDKTTELIPENICIKMLDAVSIFRDQYIAVDRYKEGLLGLVSNIKIF